MPEGPRIVLIGSVSFSRRTLEGLLRNGGNVVGVLGLLHSKGGRVSDFARMDDVAHAHGLPYEDFERVNNADVVSTVRRWAPDLLFVVGLSQMVKDELMSIPTRGAVGFHPTWLPAGRGRAPVAWLTLDATPGAATFFVLEATPDSGPILVQEPFFIGDDFYAQESVEAVRSAIDRALDRWVPDLVRGEWAPVEQDAQRATFFGVRAAQDGLISWSEPATAIARLVRAVSRPYPGAYTYTTDAKVRIWRAREEVAPHRGVIGRILEVDDEGRLLVQTGDGLLLVEELEVEPLGKDARPLRVGLRLGLSPEDEIADLKTQVADLRRRLDALGGEEEVV